MEQSHLISLSVLFAVSLNRIQNFTREQILVKMLNAATPAWFVIRPVLVAVQYPCSGRSTAGSHVEVSHVFRKIMAETTSPICISV